MAASAWRAHGVDVVGGAVDLVPALEADAVEVAPHGLLLVAPGAVRLRTPPGPPGQDRLSDLSLPVCPLFLFGVSALGVPGTQRLRSRAALHICACVRRGGGGAGACHCTPLLWVRNEEGSADDADRAQRSKGGGRDGQGAIRDLHVQQLGISMYACCAVRAFGAPQAGDPQQQCSGSARSHACEMISAAVAAVAMLLCLGRIGLLPLRSMRSFSVLLDGMACVISSGCEALGPQTWGKRASYLARCCAILPRSLILPNTRLHCGE